MTQTLRKNDNQPSSSANATLRKSALFVLLLGLCWSGWLATACGPPTPNEKAKEPVERFTLPKDSGPADNGTQEQPTPDQTSTDQPPTDKAPPKDDATPEPPPVDTAPLPPGTWPASGGGNSSDFGRQIALDAKGNIYITGEFEKTAKFGAFELTSQGGADVFVAKMDATGKFLWAAAGGSQGYDGAGGVAVDSKGQVYFTGKIDGNASFGNTRLTSIGFTDIVIAKLSADGKWEWAKVAGNINADSGEAITVDSNDDILVTGSFRGNAKFGGKTLAAGPNDNLFVARLDAAGTWKWAISRQDENSAAPAYAIGTDAKGNAYITGYYVGNAIFGGNTLQPTGGFDTYVAKITKEGKWGWVVPAAIPGPDSGRGIAVNPDGSCVVIGRFEGNGKLGATDISSKGKKDVFVAKINASGGFAWAKTYGSNSFDFARSIAVDGAGNTYASSTFQGNISVAGQSFNAAQKDNVLIVKLDPSGKMLWANNAGGDQFEAGFGIKATGAGTPFVIGYFQGSATFDGKQLKSQGLDDVFIWRVKTP